MSGSDSPYCTRSRRKKSLPAPEPVATTAHLRVLEHLMNGGTINFDVSDSEPVIEDEEVSEGLTMLVRYGEIEYVERTAKGVQRDKGYRLILLNDENKRISEYNSEIIHELQDPQSPKQKKPVPKGLIPKCLLDEPLILVVAKKLNADCSFGQMFTSADARFILNLRDCFEDPTAFSSTEE